MKIAEPINHDGVAYNYGDDVSAEDAKNLPEGYAVTDSEFKKLEEEAAASEPVDVSELTDEELANHPSQAPTVPPAVPDDEKEAAPKLAPKTGDK